MFPADINNGNNVCDFLFASLDGREFPNWKLIFRGKMLVKIRLQDLSRVVILYEIYEKSRRRVSLR